MARVYLARDLQYNRDVAIKMLNPELSAALGPDRFLREIDILAHLNHPHILPLLDSGEVRESLFYVMPYVVGESLRHRLQRETQLPIADAIAIARDVAGALDYAHRKGIVHRDIKPENILMSEGLAIVADFGIARAITLAADDERITQTGVSPGTPPYMSPEQAAGDGVVDGRSDIYALGCVLYEMLAGQPPFMGPTTQAILARHLADPVPPLRTVRKTVPVGVEQAVLKALEKVPADRYTTAGAFAAGLAAPDVEATGPDLAKLAVQIAAGVAVAAVVWFSSRVGVRPTPGPQVDTTLYAVFPSSRDSGLPDFNEYQLLQDAMMRWTGISTVDGPRLEAVMRDRGGSGSNRAAAARVTGAGRYVESQISRVGDSLRIQAAVYSVTQPGPPLQEGVVKMSLNAPPSDRVFSQLADKLLFGKAGPGQFLDPPAGTISRPARQSFANGLDSIYAWNLRGADSEFTAASGFDPQFALAHLWLALVRSWSAAPAASWQSPAERAATQRARLSQRDRLVSDGLLALARGDSTPCRRWRQATAFSPDDFVTWYSLANCLTGDRVVVRDRSSPSGWLFRSSYHEATKAYMRAFQLLPSVHKSFASDAFLSVRRLFWTSGDAVRYGNAIDPDTGMFLSYASLQDDTLAFYPYRPAQLTRPLSTKLAVRHERELFRDVATAWVSEFPQSADALNALAVALDLVGNPTAIDTLERARAVAVLSSQRIRTASAEVWLRIKLGVPADVKGVRRARLLADSLLQAFPPGSPEPLLLASIALLTGRSGLAAAYSEQPQASRDRGVPPPLMKLALPLTSFAALGGPSDSLRLYEGRVQAVVDGVLEQSQRPRAREEWLVRPATLAFPLYRFQSLSALSGSDELLDAMLASARGDTAIAHHMFRSLRDQRRNFEPSDLSLDVLYPEAWLLATLHDDRAAITWLEPTLAALPRTSPEMFTDLPRSAALVHAMSLRAELAARVGDEPTATGWARIVTILWSNADPFLQPIVRRMADLEH